MALSEREISLWLKLSFTPGMKPVFLPALIATFGTVENIFAAGLLDLGTNGKLPADVAGGIVTNAGEKPADEEMEFCEKSGIAIVPYSSPNYPGLLTRIPDPPLVLYARGVLDRFQMPNVSVVGSRKASAYGTQVAHRLSADLAMRGVAVVSGLAYGIDQAAHNGALSVDNGRTIAVIGSGLANIYPRGCDRLIERIVESGLVLSEFTHDTPPSRFTFPMRNRIVAGISYLTMVVEAGKKSGALITARLALEQNRELLAVPGPVYSENSFGTNYLIKRGAKLVQHADDIIEELPREIRDKLPDAGKIVEKIALNGHERAVLDFLSVDSPMHVDIIAGHLGMSTPDLSLVLIGLEMKSLVQQLPGMEYIKSVN